MATALAAAALMGARPLRAQKLNEIVVESDIEYSNPDNQHLQLNMARPKGEAAENADAAMLAFFDAHLKKL